MSDQSKWAAALVALFASITLTIAVIKSDLWSAGKSGARAPNENRVELVTARGVHVFDVELAATREEQALGLMYRTHLPERRGMLFPYAEPREVTMWMRNTYIPLDMVFIRADGTVHRIEGKTEPLSERLISSQGAVTGVLEIAGGAAEKIGLKPGDTVRHPHFRAVSP